MFKDYQQNQGQLLPQSLSDSISPDHPARLINQVIDEMDLSFILNTYSAMGQKAYDPRMLFKVLVYGYTIGRRSSRKIADRLNEEVVFMWLSGRSTPDFRTIADFRKDKLSDVKKAFVEGFGLCRQLDMIRIGKVAIDGTKFRSDSNGNKTQYRKTLNKRKESIEEQVDGIFREADEVDRLKLFLIKNRLLSSNSQASSRTVWRGTPLITDFEKMFELGIVETQNKKQGDGSPCFLFFISP